MESVYGLLGTSLMIKKVTETSGQMVRCGLVRASVSAHAFLIVVGEPLAHKGVTIRFRGGGEARVFLQKELFIPHVERRKLFISHV